MIILRGTAGYDILDDEISTLLKRFFVSNLEMSLNQFSFFDVGVDALSMFV
jgi:hypothetical protein